MSCAPRGVFSRRSKRSRECGSRCERKIPHGAGLGGGSSDAASTLLGLNALHGQPAHAVAPNESGGGAWLRCSFFSRSKARRFAAVAAKSSSRSPALPKLPLLLLKPEFGVPTPWAYQHWRDSRELSGIDYAPQSLGELILENDLERPVFEKYLFLARMKEWLRAQPEVAVALMSGSGSTMFAVLSEAAAGGCACCSRAERTGSGALDLRDARFVRRAARRGDRRRSATSSRDYPASPPTPLSSGNRGW